MRPNKDRDRLEVRVVADYGWVFKAAITALFLIASLLLLSTAETFAVSASPDPILVRQPDGTSISLYLKGDERFHWNEDGTGFPVVRAADGVTWVYAAEQLGRLAPTSFVAGSVDPIAAGLTKPDVIKLRKEALKDPRTMLQSDIDETQRAPLASTMYNLVVLVNYDDLAFTRTRQEFDDLFNQVGYTTDGAVGSVRDYYDEVSYGDLTVQSIVVEPVTVSRGYAYYGANDSWGWDLRPRELVAEALAALEARGFDFNSVDGDGDGWVDGLTIIHAGGGEEYAGNDPDYIWSHAWSMISTLTYDGVSMRPYHTEPERRGWDSSPSSWGITRIGVICHETGHFIGMPDLYDYGYDSEGAGDFCLMAGGSWNGSSGTSPSHPSAFCRSLVGWVTPTVVTTGGVYDIAQVEANRDIYKLQGGLFPSYEYFLVENRQGYGFDSALPGTERGLLIWHVDESQPDNDDQTHYLVDLEEASGTQHLALNINQGDDLDYYRASYVFEFTSSSTPNNLSYSMQPLGLDISSVSSSGAFMSFIVNGLDLNITAPSPGVSLDVGDTYLITWTVYGGTPDSLTILLSTDSGASYPYTVATGVTGTSYSWDVPNLPVPTARLKLVAYIDDEVAGSTEMYDDFTIVGSPYRYVSPTGGDIYPYTLPAWAAHTIVDALDAANPGDSIMVAAATYNSKISVDKAVHLMGGWDAAFTVRDPETNVTTINSAGSTVSFVSIMSGSAGIEGFRITGGTGTSTSMPTLGIYGGGIFVYRSDVLIRDNVITGCGYTSNTSFSAGGGIACYDGAVTIEDNDILGCVAQSGGGVYVYQATVTLTGNRISGALPNPVYTGEKNGGGVYARQADVTMSGNAIFGNNGYSNGGGIYAKLTPLSMDGDSLYSNESTNHGGGMYAYGSAMSISRAYIAGNGAANFGGGIYHKAQMFDLSNSIVTSNTSGIIGAGAYADSCWGDWTNNTFDGNSAVYAGGNAFVGAAAPLDVRNNIFSFGSGNGFEVSSSTNITYQYNNAYGNTPSDVMTITPDATNIGRDPKYADAPSFDYHLALHSGSVDAGDPSISDPDGSRSDQGAFGGLSAVFEAPEYVQNLTAVATDDTTITISWDGRAPEGSDYYAVYSDTASLFAPGESNFIGTVDASASVFQHHPVEGCNYYRVSYIGSSGYMSGYSNEASECVAGQDLIPPTVAVTHPDGGEVFAAGDTIDIQWSAEDNRGVDSVSIYYSKNAGADFILIAGGEPNDQSYIWIAPEIASDSCLVRVVAFDQALLTGEDVSDAVFTIEAATSGDDTPALAFALSQNFPNPFNPVTTIKYDVKAGGGNVSILVYDVSGKLVRTLVNGFQTEGNKTAVWNGNNDRGQRVASGIYFYRMSAPGFSQTRKMVLMR